MLLLTGATGLVCRALLARLTAAHVPRRGLVRDPRHAVRRLRAVRALLALMRMWGRGRAVYQPIWADDVADCVIAALAGPRTADAANGGGAQLGSGDGAAGERASVRYELAGPE